MTSARRTKVVIDRPQPLLAQLDKAKYADVKVDRRIARTRLALLDAAQRLLSTRSIDGISIDEIISEADVAKGSFYNHFSDKEALADELYQMIRQHAAELVASDVDPEAEAPERLVQGAFILLRFTKDHPESAAALIRLSPELLSRSAPLNMQAREIITDGIETGHFKGMPADSATLLVVGVLLVMHQEVIASQWPMKRLVSKMSPLMAGMLKALGMDDDHAQAATQRAIDYCFTNS